MTPDRAPQDASQPSRRKPVIVLAVVVVALGISVAYNVWSAGRYDVEPVKRTLLDFIVDWRCLACGHVVVERGAVGARTCPACGRNEMYVSIRHGCPTHGVFPVAFQYDESGDVLQIKVADGDWVPSADAEGNWNTRCPKCGVIMMPAEAPRPAPRGPKGQNP